MYKRGVHEFMGKLPEWVLLAKIGKILKINIRLEMLGHQVIVNY